MYTTIQTKIASLKIFPGQVLYILQIVQYIFSYFPYTFFNKIFLRKKKTQNSTMCLSFKYGFDLSVGKLLFRCCYSIIGFLQEIPRFMSYLKGVFFQVKIKPQTVYTLYITHDWVSLWKIWFYFVQTSNIRN